MKSLFEKVELLAKHLLLLDKTFKDKSNYTNHVDYLIYSENERVIKKIANYEKLKSVNLKTRDSDVSYIVPSSFSDEIYGESDRQMKLADIIEYVLYSRGVYYLFQSDKYKQSRVSTFLEINLRIVNLLMVYESLTVDKKLRDAFLKNLQPITYQEKGREELLAWEDSVGLSYNNSKFNKDAPNLYFDTLLPKTAGGLWHEILVYCFILKYNLGYIFPLLLTQKPISLMHKLSPPDIVLLHNKTFRYYGIEIGNLKERQSGGFMAPSGIPIIPIDTTNARISDRCPSCNKWIGICPKVIRDFSKCDFEEPDSKLTNEIRCLIECDIFTLDEKLNGTCKYMKFRYKNKSWKFPFANGNHYHYHCCISANPVLRIKIKAIKYWLDLTNLDKLLQKKELSENDLNEKTELQKKLKSKYSFIKTHSIYYSELSMLFQMSRGDISFANIDSHEEEPDTN